MKKQALFSGLADAMGGSPEARIAANSIGYGGTAFILAALARAMVQQQDPHESYAGVDTAKQVNTTMDDPIVSAELSKDLKQSVKRQNKEASLYKKADTTMSDIMKLAIPTGAAVLGGALGYRLVDDVYDKSTAKKLKEEKALLASLHKKVVMARALNARGQLSEDMYRDILMEAHPLLAKQAMDRHMNKTAGGGLVKDYAAPALGLALSIAFAASAYGSHQYFASRNVDRLRHKAIKEGLGEYAMQQSMMRPIEHSLTDDPKVKAMLESIEAKKKASPTETPMIHTSVTI